MVAVEGTLLEALFYFLFEWGALEQSINDLCLHDGRWIWFRTAAQVKDIPFEIISY